MSVVKSANVVGYSAPGIAITYSYLVTNTGNVDLTAVSVTDPQPNLSAVTCPSPSLAPAASETCTASYTTTQADVDAGSISNTGTAGGTAPDGSIVTATSSVTIPASDAPTISVVKTASVANYSAPGVPITYSYNVTNTGNVDLTAVSVTDPQPGLSAVTCPSTTLAPTAAETCTASYTTTQADVDAGSISNIGTASGTFQTGPAVTATSSLTIPAIDTPAISLAKTASVTSYSASGTPITYSYKVTNSGNVTLNSVSVTDPQAGLSAVSCPSPSLAPGASETCTASYTTTQADVNAGSILNTGTASGKAPSGSAVTATSSLTIPLTAAPAISLVKTANVASYSASGTPITYSYKVTNTGNVALTAVSVTDPQVGLSAVTCPSSSLAPGAFETCTATYTTTQADVNAGSVSNTGTAHGTPPTGPAVTATSSLTIQAVETPAISLMKTANVTSFTASGTPITYSYKVTNTGNVTLNSVSVTDPHVGLSAITCPNASLAPGASETCTASYTTTQADVDAGSISNTGTAHGTPPSGPAVTSTSSVTIPLSAAPAIGVVKTANVASYSAPGIVITYSYLVTNAGNVSLTAVSVTDPHAGLSAITCPSPSLAPGASETCTATYSTTQLDLDAGSIPNTGTAHGTPPTGPAVTAASSLTIPAIESPAISLVKTANVASYSAPGTVITYSYLVTNTGNVDLTAVSVTDPHVGLSAVSCPSASLTPGIGETCTATYTTMQADVDAGSISNTGTARGTPITAPAVTATSTLKIMATDAPAMSLKKSASVTSYSAAGTPITYSYLVTNTGNVDLSAVSVTDPHVGLSAVSCPSASLAPGIGETCTATYTTTQADVDAGSISNTGTATGTPPAGPAVTATSSLTISASDTPALTVVKSASATSYSAAGTLITYSYLVTNTGNVDLTAVSVTDPHVGLSAVSCPNASLAPAATETCTATYTTTQGDVDAGSISNTGTASGTPPTGPPVTAMSSLTILAMDTPAVSVVKTANVANYSAPGKVITYSYLVTNTGNVDLTAVLVTDPHANLSAVTCPSATLAPAASETCTANYTTTQADVDAGSISNTGTASGTPPTGPAVTATSSLTIPASVAPALSVVKSASIANYSATGTAITYFYKVTNTGNVDLTAVSVTDPQPGLSAISCPSARLAPAASETCTASYTTTQADLDAGSISNIGTASGTPPTGPAVTATSSLTLPAIANPSLSLAKSASVTSYSASGTPITYSYLVTNTGNLDLSAISVTDPHVGLSAISCPSPSLAPGAAETCTASYTTTQADVTAGSITNTASASGKAPSGVSIVSPRSTVTIHTATVSVTVATSTSGPTISVDGGVSYTGSQNFTWTIGSQHTLATTSPQTPTAGTQYTFSNWSDSGAISHSATASAGTLSYNASFNTSYLLTTAVSPSGGGTVTPASGSYYAAGTPVPLIATASTGYKFANWTGPVANASSASTSVTMTGPESVTANFVVNNVGVTINTTPAGLTVSVDGGTPHAAPVAVTWQIGSQHTIATTSPQTPIAGAKYTFASWSDSGAISHSVTASASTPSYTASFNTSYLLTTGVSPSAGGTVSPASGSYYAAGTPAPLVATPSVGYVFSSWTGPVASAGSASTNVTMTGPESVTANFISALSVSPSPAYNFGTVYLGSVTTENFTVTNMGTTPISISGPVISIVKGGNSNEFVEVNECPKSLAGGSHCTISVSFIAGPYYNPQTATLSIMDNAPGNPQTVTLTATVIDPVPSFSPTSLSFGNQTVNTSVTKTVTLKNTGATTLSITGMTVTGSGATEFKLTPASSCGSSLTAGSSCTISVTFKPVAKVSYAATLNVTDNAQQNTQTVPLSGTGH